ncbi:MAG: hypothetical protein Q8S03_16975 [Brevundimonas sp.]|uniref:hypothetical protein n=1 Tax=Brevundimonas sp. TaxID=1871086 RepID=UPI002735EB9A|nr:hypothetical protein [Brevundimonas sp.]MDP3406386.1 hypothetical protein [Brevundimonas sp.]
MTSLPAILLIVLSLGLLALGSRRKAIEARPRGVMLFRALQTALLLASIALLCWQMFAIGFQMGGDIARRDARAEARAAARA